MPRDRAEVGRQLGKELLNQYVGLDVAYIIATKVGRMLDQDDADERWCEETGEC
jgi:hypothetical protein